MVHPVDLPGGHPNFPDRILELHEVGLGPPAEELGDAPDAAGPKYEA